MFPYTTIALPLFWMILGVLLFVFFIGLNYWFQDFKIRMNWWKWLLVTIWLFILAFSLSAGFTLIGENETKAGLRFMLFFAVILLLTGSGLWKLLRKT